MLQRATKKVRFTNHLGVELAAVLDLPKGQRRGTVLFAHCFTCSKDLRSARILSHGLVAQGFGVLRFDFTGLGESEGEFSASTFTNNVQDLVAAADFLRDELEAPSVLVGHSLGGAAVLMAAPKIPEVQAVATIGAPSDPSHLREGALKEADPDQECSEVDIGGRPFKVSSQFLHDLSNHCLLEQLGDLRKAILILHSPVDDIVSVDHARKLYEAAKHPKSFVSLDGADHLLLKDPKDAEFVAGILATWANRYIQSSPAEQNGRSGGEVPTGVVQVAGGESKYTNVVTTPNHQLTTDEPKSVGGADLGPNPYEMLLGGLGSCISMTLRMYADRKGIPLESVKVRLKHSRVHGKDCAECETKDGLVDVIEKQLEIIGPDLTDAQLQRLREISERCPVHRTLTSETRVRTVESL